MKEQNFHPAVLSAINQKVIRTGSELDYPPYALVDKNGKAGGFSVELFKAVCKEEDLKPEFIVEPWHKLRHMLESGELDALPNVGLSKERDLVFDFSTPHTALYGVVFKNKKASDIISAHDLHGKQILVMSGDAGHDWLVRNDVSSNLILTETVSEALGRLENGEYHYALVPRLVGIHLKNAMGLTNIEITGPLLDAYGRGYGFAVKEGNKELLAILQRGLQKIKSNGTYDLIYDKWFTRGEIKHKPRGHLDKFVLWLLAACGVLICFGMLWIYTLKRTVAQQTKELSKDKKELQSIVEQRSQEIRQQKERLELTLSNTLTGTWEWNVATGEIVHNDMQARIYGYEPGELAPVIKTFEELLHPEDLKKHIKTCEKLFNGLEDSFYDEIRIRHKDGHYIWVQNMGNVIERAPNGQPLWLYGTQHDITERKLREAELAKFKMIADKASYGNCITELDGTILYINQSWADMHGYSRKDLIGQNIVMCHPERMHKQLVNDMENMAKGIGNLINKKLVHQHKDCSEFTTLAIATAILNEDGKPEFLAATISDITAQEEAERKLRARERDFKNLFENALSGIALHEMVFDKEGNPSNYRYLQVNEAFEKHTSISADLAVNNLVTDIIPDVVVPPYLDIYARVMRTGKPIVFEDYFLPLDKHFSIIAYPVGQNRFGTVFEDVTKRHKMEQALIQEKEAAQQASEAKSRFLANMSHELRTPLNSINGFSEMMATEILGPMPDHYKEYAGNINHSGTHLLRIINEIIDMSKVEAGQVHLDKVRVEIKDIFKQAEMLMQDLLSRYNVQLEADIEDNLEIVADATRLKQIIVNIVTNAIKFAPDSTVYFSAVAQKYLTETVRLQVVDEGIGMTQDEIQIALKPFEQVESSYLTRTTEGSGLGLPLTVELVKLHGGTLEVDSRPQEGTTITIVMPAE